MMKTHSRHFFIFLIAFISTIATAHIVYACQASNAFTSTFGGRVVTDGYGYRGDYGIGNSTFHRAYDLRVHDNPNVGAFFGGTVSTGNIRGYGNTAYVTNGNLRARYSHAGSLGVSNGQTVNAGDTLGNWSTCTGICKGAHLDLGYEVMHNGQWMKVDPGLAQSLIDGGADPQSAQFAEDAVNGTANRCDVDPDALKANNPSRPGGVATQDDRLCDPEIFKLTQLKIDANVALINNHLQHRIRPPAPIQQASNTPCVSNELNRIGNQFMYAVGPGPLGTIQGGINQLAGPLSSITNNFFKAGFESLNQAMSFTSGAAFQNLSSSALNSLLSVLPFGSQFNPAVCGLMVDMLLKYLQCENPIEIPSLGNLTGGLNDLLPNNCAGNVAREALYKAVNSDATRSIAESAGEAVVRTIQNPTGQ